MTMLTQQNFEIESENISPVNLANLLPSYNERAFYCGRTGSGKTTLAECNLRHYPYVVALDTKGRMAWEGWDRQESLELVAKSQASHRIYAPSWLELTTRDESTKRFIYIEEFFRWAYHRENTVIYVDEVFSIAQGDKMPVYYQAAITRGRELGIGVHSSAQRPKWLPQIVMSEVDVFYVFNLQMPQDIQRVEDVAEGFLPKRSNHEFAYKRMGTDEQFKKYVLIP